MPSFLIEMLGDGDRDLMEHAVKHAADRGYAAHVTLGPDGLNGSYVVRNYRSPRGEGDTVELIPWSEPDDRPVPSEARRVPVDDIWELRIY